MRPIKMLGHAAVAAMAAMAFVGATSASATSTQLCNSHSALTCGEGQAATVVNMVNSGAGRLLSSLVDIICDEISGKGTPLALGNPQSIHLSDYEIQSCETIGGDACLVFELESPLATLSKTGLDSGVISGTNGIALLECEDVFFSTDIHCVFGSNLQLSVGSQHITANETEGHILEGSSLCPDETFFDGLMVTTANRYVLA